MKLLVTISLGFFSMLFTSQLFGQGFEVFNTTTTPAITGNNFKSICAGAGGYIWAGTQYQGLYRYDPILKTWTKLTELTNVLINDIKSDQYGGIWVAQSGTSGQTGGGSNIAGGINFFSNPLVTSSFYSTTPGGGLTSRNARSIWIDTSRFNVAQGYPKVWCAQGTFITSGNTVAGGISTGLNQTSNYFTKVTNGLQVFPYVPILFAATPSCLAVGGNKNEVWVFAQQNFTHSQIIRYQPGNPNGAYLGHYDNVTVPLLSNAFKANAIYFDNDNRQWIGLSVNGCVVKDGSTWKSVNMQPIFSAGVTINPNAITGDPYGDIYIGTSTGLVVYGGGPVDDVNSYQLFTTADGLPSNNINQVAYDTVTNKVLIATDNGVAFWQRRRNINVQLVWDNSFPVQNVKPKGVAADGVARLYFKVKRNTDTLPAIQKVEVSIKNYDGNYPTLSGKLKVADTLLLNKYSQEATDITTTSASRTDSTSKGEFWFWYLSPEDYSPNSTHPFASLTERKDTVKVRVTFSTGFVDSTYLSVRVVRPPLVLVHGLASSPEAWDIFTDGAGIPFKDHPMFKYRHAMKMDGRAAFIQNAKMLVAGDIALGQGAARLSTLQGNIEEIRKMGYAANQVDYVCHSMGGIMARTTIRWQHAKFYANGGYKYNNYGKGFMHELITVNTPHNGACPGDLVGKYFPQLPQSVNQLMNSWYLASPDDIIPFDFVLPTSFGLNSTFGPSPAVANLSISTLWGAVKMVQTDVRYHMIVGDVQLVPAGLPGILGDMDKYVRLFNYTLDAARAVALPPVKGILTGFLGAGRVLGAITFMEWVHQQNNVPGYLTGSDLIVPLKSQTAGQDPNTPLNITKYTGFNAWHSSILSRPDVGQRVMDLINTKVSSNFFGASIPANNAPDPPGARWMNSTSGTVQSFYDTSKIVITAPHRMDSTFADSLLHLSYHLKDTTGLVYIRINFQDYDSVTFLKTANQSLTIPVNPAYAGTQRITVMAIFDKNDTTIYHVDTLSNVVGNKGTLNGFRTVQHLVEIISGTPYRASYQVKYDTNWVSLSSRDSLISVSFDVPGIVSYDTASRTFNALSENFAQAYIQYKGFTDTVSFQSEMSLYSNCINRTIASGSFKNPAIWSKMVVPDICDSIIIDSGFTVTLDTTITANALRISHGGVLNINNSAFSLHLGTPDDGNCIADNYGSLNISSGNLTVSGRVKLNSNSTFNMTGGAVILNANTNDAYTSLPDGLFMFDVAPSLQSFLFTGGTLQITDPPYSENSQTIRCSYNFGDSSILQFGNGISTVSGKNNNGFGSNYFPAKVGRVILDAVTGNGNRQLTLVNSLIVKGSFNVKTGSRLNLNALLKIQ